MRPWPRPTAAQGEFEARGLDARRKAVACIRKICIDKAEMLGLEEFEETKIGRLKHKVEKLIVACAKKRRAWSFSRTEAFSGENGVTLQEFAPFGVVGIITPVTHSLPTLAGNAINILAAGNALVCNPHPAGCKIACMAHAAFQPGDSRSHRHRQSHHHHPGTDAGIGPGHFRSSRRAASCASRADPLSAARPCAAPSGPSSPGRAIRRWSSMKPPTWTTPLARSSPAAPTTTIFCASAKRKSSPWPASSMNCCSA